MRKFDQGIDQYILDLSTPEDPLLAELSRETHLKTTHPNMLSGPVLGKYLEMLSHMIKPRRILEIGTFTGYSAICLARGLADGGRLITVDINDELGDMASRYFAKAGMSDRIEQVHGNALDIMEDMTESFDLVFIDGDKREYTRYYELVVPKLRSGGYILADNVLWSGKVIDPGSKNDPETRGILAFNNRVSRDTRVENVILSVRDGIQLVRKF